MFLSLCFYEVSFLYCGPEEMLFNFYLVLFFCLFICFCFFAVEMRNTLELELETLSAVQGNKNQVLLDLNVNIINYNHCGLLIIPQK